MNQRYNAMLIAILVLISSSNSFRRMAFHNRFKTLVSTPTITHSFRSSSLAMSTREKDAETSRIAKMYATAAQLRAEAAQLESEQQQQFAQLLSATFEDFDTNKDGSIDINELRDILETRLKKSVAESQVRKVMEAFDTSGDGSLQIEEFKGIDSFVKKLEAVVREEKENAIKAQAEAKRAKDESLTASKKLESITDMINNKPPSVSDKLVSTLPYLLPLVDALPYSQAYIRDFHLETSPIFALAAVVFSLYQKVPFAGLLAFVAINYASANLQLNRLVRYNLQQALLLDIALIVPSILNGILQVAATQLNYPISPALLDGLSTSTFFITSAAILYSVASSVTGNVPDKLPLISGRVSQIVPTTDDIVKAAQEFFDRDGNMLPPDDIKRIMDEKRNPGDKKDQQDKRGKDNKDK